MSAGSRIHDQIVELISKSHSTTETIEARIYSLQQATELLLFHSASNDRVDEFLETLLSLHVGREAPFRRFCAYFIDLLCFTRSRYACSCLEVLVTLLQDNDRQVQIFALRAARTVYKRALYWISVQQREMLYVDAARESIETLDFVLARVVHLITSSSREVFCEAIRCAQAVVLCQSHSSFAAKSQAQLEAAGLSCLEDLKLHDSPSNALDETKLKGQADRLFTALCALLVKKRDESAPDMEIVALIKAVGAVGHQRPAYAAAATVAFNQLAEEYKEGSGKNNSQRIKSCLITELKRLLSSRHCVMWQPRLIPVLASLGIGDSNIVLRAEVERLKDQAETEQGLQAPTKRRRIDNEGEGERLMALSETADAIKVPDENHAEAVYAVRAQSPADLARLALNMLGKLPKSFDDPMTALIRVNRATAGGVAGSSVGFETRVKAARAMEIQTSDFFNQHTEDMDTAGSGDSGEEEEEEMGNIDEPSSSLVESTVDIADLAGRIGALRADLFSKILFGLKSTSRETKIGLIRSFFKQAKMEAITGLFSTVDDNSDVSLNDLGLILTENAPSVADLKSLFSSLPTIPTVLLDYLDSRVDVNERRSALMVLAGLITTRPDHATEYLERLVSQCSVSSEGARTDALKLVLAKVYRPQPTLLRSQWPYETSPEAGLHIVETLKDSVSRIDYVCSENLEQLARRNLEEASSTHDWSKAWLMLALCSKKPKLIHGLLDTMMEHVPAEASIPNDVMQPFALSLLSLSSEMIDPELEVIVKNYKSVRAVAKKKHRNEFLLPILSALSSTERGLTGNLADAALSLRK